MVLFQFDNEVRHGGKIDAQACLTGFQCQGHSQMRLAYAGRAKKDDVSFLTDKGQVEQRHDPLAVQLGLEGKIKVVDPLDERQPGYF